MRTFIDLDTEMSKQDIIGDALLKYIADNQGCNQTELLRACVGAGSYDATVKRLRGLCRDGEVFYVVNEWAKEYFIRNGR